MSIPAWTGSSKDKIDGEEWLRLLRLHYREARTPEEEIMEDKWFRGLDEDTERKTWAQFQRAFRARYPVPVKVETPRLQLLAEISGMRISLAEIAKKTVEVKGVEVPVKRASCADSELRLAKLKYGLA
ncbi:hypothetical protein B0H16DRAFT_1484929 [Mycena metata]|uniref:Uncharacterized protein n=1 Tax=Mycena metata TaxID=1033252 RepID=A0AAD7GIX4_9AGAR|nr:hypothetical protein B0H16DRAFT_1484929 [Mycena metata]